jgi:hypothetical protein
MADSFNVAIIWGVIMGKVSIRVRNIKEGGGRMNFFMFPKITAYSQTISRNAINTPGTIYPAE